MILCRTLFAQILILESQKITYLFFMVLIFRMFSSRLLFLLALAFASLAAALALAAARFVLASSCLAFFSWLDNSSTRLFAASTNSSFSRKLFCAPFAAACAFAAFALAVCIARVNVFNCVSTKKRKRRYESISSIPSCDPIFKMLKVFHGKYRSSNNKMNRVGNWITSVNGWT